MATQAAMLWGPTLVSSPNLSTVMVAREAQPATPARCNAPTRRTYGLAVLSFPRRPLIGGTT